MHYLPAFLALSAALVPHWAHAQASTQDNVTDWVVPETIRAGSSTTFLLTTNIADGRDEFLIDWYLVAGRAELAAASGTANIVDVIQLNGDGATAGYQIPTNLPAGIYHVLVNMTTNTTSPPAELEHVIGRSPDISITSGQFSCTTPPVWPNITGANDPEYRSFTLTNPLAGDVWNLGDSGDYIDWSWVDARNDYGAGIDKLTFSLIKDGSNSQKDTVSIDPTSSQYLFMLNNGNGLSAGEWRLYVTYTNIYEDSPVNYTSQPFYIAKADTTCGDVSGSGVLGGIFNAGFKLSASWTMIGAVASGILAFLA